MKNTQEINSIYKEVYSVYGEDAITMILFSIASMFQNIVEKEREFFPLLFVHGYQSSGKTHLANNIGLLSGHGTINDHLHNRSFYLFKKIIEESSKSNKKITLLEEYKSGSQFLNGSLRGLWDRFGYQRASIVTESIEEVKPKTAFIITGTVYPDSQSLITRMICINLKKVTFSNEEFHNYEELKLMLNEKTASVFKSILEYEVYVCANFVSFFKEKKQNIKECNLNAPARIIDNYAVLVSMYSIFNDFIEFPFSEEVMMKYFMDSIQNQQNIINLLNEF